jgi:hypothetical protein
MPHYQTSVRTPWATERAFEYMSNLENFDEWDPGTKQATRVVGDAPGLGTAYDLVVRAAGRDMTLRYETIEFDAPRRLTAQADTGTLRSLDIITVEPAPDGGSIVTYDATLSLKGLAKLGTPLLALAFQRIGDQAAAGLRQALEGTEA